MGPEHIETLARLEQACFSAPWSFDALAGELSDPLAVFRVATVNGQVVHITSAQAEPGDDMVFHFVFDVTLSGLLDPPAGEPMEDLEMREGLKE